MTVFAKGCLLPNKNEIAKLPLVEEVACPDVSFISAQFVFILPKLILCVI